MTYSLDFRKQVLKELKDGLSYRKVARHYGISVSTILNWEADINIQTTRNKRPIKIHDEALKQDIADHPDAYHYERAGRLNCSEAGIRRALKRLNITRKKRV